jgi:hypothetical protein
MSGAASTTRTLDHVERLAAVSTLIASLELLARPQVYQDGNLMSWRVGQVRSRRFLTGPVGRLLRFLLAYNAFRILLVVRAVGSACLVVSAVTGWPAAAVRTLMAVSSLPMMVRSPYGWDGADQMSALTFLALASRSWLPEIAPDVQRFFTFQLCLSYLSSGVAKAVSPGWRSGGALLGIVGTEMYGNDAVHDWLRAHPAVATAIARSVIGCECAFPLILVAPRPLRRCGLLGGVVFHALAARVMGLNTFFWSFVAVYPAVEGFCNARIDTIPGRGHDERD